MYALTGGVGTVNGKEGGSRFSYRDDYGNLKEWEKRRKNGVRVQGALHTSYVFFCYK